jgi:predicted nucleic-acid-binding protein
MNKNIQKQIEELGSTDDKIRMDALQNLLKITESKVDWVYEVWDLLLEKLVNENSYQRSIGVKLLCNLAKSDIENRLATSLDRLLVHTKDDKFITSRQCIQSIWKIAAANKPNREKVVKHLEKRFVECIDEKHYNLLRQDIIQSMLALYKAEKDDTLLARAQALIEKEQEPKYRKQYEALLKAK